MFPEKIAKKLWLSLIILMAVMTVACSDSDDNTEPTTTPTETIDEQIAKMSLRQKVGQMFFVRPEALLTNMGDMQNVTANAVTSLSDGMTSTELSCGNDVQSLNWSIFEASDDVLEVVPVFLVDALSVHHVQLVAELAVVRLSKE